MSSRCCPQVASRLSRLVHMVRLEPVDRSSHRVFRSRAVVAAGVVDFVIGLLLGVIGIGYATSGSSPNALPLGIAICVVGLMMLITGLGRMTARVVLTPTEVLWRWSFSGQRIALGDLVDCALVEKGSPASGASGAGILGGGFISVLTWWLVDAASGLARSKPSLGSLELVAIKRYGGPVPIRAISAWSTPSSHSQASEALLALQTAIHTATRPEPETLPILRSDRWDIPEKS
jgi:hypothetical protein